MTVSGPCDPTGSRRPLRIVIANVYGPGHYNSTFALARHLRDRGHRVIYLGVPDARKWVAAQGFEFVSFAEDILPEGATREPAEPPFSAIATVLRQWPQRLANERMFAQYLLRLSQGHLDERLLSCGPDLLLCDPLVWYVALRAMHLGIPTIHLASFLSGKPNPHVPPILCPRIPCDSGWGRMQVRSDWLLMRARFLFTKRLASHLLGRFRYPSRMHHLAGEFRRLAKLAGVPCVANRTFWHSEFGPRLALPEIILCPKSFDFSHNLPVERRYCGAFIDLNRREDAPLPSNLDPQKPLVYCSLGSAAPFYPHSERFFRSVVAASRLREDWQWVLSVGSRPQGDRFSDAGASLVVVKWAPQLSLLRRAAVMVTHGGLNSIMECIHLSVPMVIVPALRDQPGNMARAVHHGIAVAANMKNLTGEQLVARVEHALGDDSFRRALAGMKQDIAAEGGAEAAVELIESTARAEVS